MPSFTLPSASTSYSAALPSTAFHVALLIGAIWGTRAGTLAISEHTIEIPIDWAVRPVGHPVSATSMATIPGVPVTPEGIIPTIDLSGLPPLLPGWREHFPVNPVPAGWATLPGFAGNDSISTAQIFLESEVDELPSLLSPGRLRYPPVLAEAGIAGAVTLTFVIDAEGKVDPSAIEILAATHAGFVAAAKEAVSTSRFRPARKQGSAVRVRVRQTVTFRK